MECVGSSLVCSSGHEHPVIDGVPVLLRDDIEQTIDLANKSLESAKAHLRGYRCGDDFVETLGISETQKADLRAATVQGDSLIDPTASALVAATNGILYKHLVGSLPSYPIPALSLSAGNGEVFLDVGCSWGRWWFLSLSFCRRGSRQDWRYGEPGGEESHLEGGRCFRDGWCGF